MTVVVQMPGQKYAICREFVAAKSFSNPTKIYNKKIHYVAKVNKEQKLMWSIYSFYTCDFHAQIICYTAILNALLMKMGKLYLAKLYYDLQF